MDEKEQRKGEAEKCRKLGLAINQRYNVAESKYKFYPTAAAGWHPMYRVCARALSCAVVCALEKNYKRAAILYFGHRPWSPHGSIF